MGGGDFSTEAYEQLREAYAKDQQRQVDDEIKGTQIMGQEYGLETVPVDSPWADKIEKWEYPSGRGQHMDEKQSPDEILQIMRDSAQERIDAAKEAEDETEEEDLDSDAEAARQSEVIAEAEAEETDEDEDESDDVDIAEMSDEEFDSHIDAIIDGDDEEDEDEDDSDEDESDEDDDESDTEDEEETEEDDLVLIPADDLAAQIAELRAELEGMQFVSDSEEEPESDESE